MFGAEAASIAEAVGAEVAPALRARLKTGEGTSEKDV